MDVPPSPGLVRYHWYFLAVLVYYCYSVLGQAVDTHGPPRVEKNPVYLDSFVPAGMQLIAHVTDLMKYEPAIPVTTGVPTPATLPHKPGIFAPVTPPGNKYQKWPPFATTTTSRRPWWKLGESPQNGETGSYLTTYRNGWSFHTAIAATTTPSQPEQSTSTSDNDDIDLLGLLPSDLYKKVNTIPDFDDDADVFGQVAKFSDDYDDKVPPFLRKKRPPPTRAYVTLLSLYDNLNKEAKKLSLNKYAGYSRRTLEDLEKFSRGTSAYQLENILNKIVERRDITEQQIVKKLTTLVDDLRQPDSYIVEALRDIPALVYDIKF